MNASYCQDTERGRITFAMFLFQLRLEFIPTEMVTETSSGVKAKLSKVVAGERKSIHIISCADVKCPEAQTNSIHRIFYQLQLCIS